MGILKLKDWVKISRATWKNERCSFCGRRPRLAEMWPGTAWVYQMCVDQPGCKGNERVREGLLRHGLALEEARGVNMPVLRGEDGTLLWRPPLSPPNGPSWWAEPHMVHPMCAVIDQIMDAQKYTGDKIHVPSQPWCAWCGFPIKWTTGPASDGLIYCEVCAEWLTAHHDLHAQRMREFDAEVAEAAGLPSKPVGRRSILLVGDLHGPRV